MEVPFKKHLDKQLYEQGDINHLGHKIGITASAPG